MSKSSLRLRIFLPMGALLALPLQLAAQEIRLYTWEGRVDTQISLTMQGGNTSTSATGGNEFAGRFSVNSALPRQEGLIRVALNSGRGNAVVVEQPSARNNYSAVVRLADANTGRDRYQVTVYFTPTRTTEAYNRDRQDNGNRGWNDDANRNRNDNGNRGWNDDRGRNDYGNRAWNDGNRGRRVGQTAVLHWSGMVDANAEVRWQGASVVQRAFSGNALRNVRSSVSGNMNMNRGQMRQGDQASVSVREGRGQVAVVQQPSAGNGYVTIVRIRDPQGGYGRYDFDVALQ